MTKALTTEIDYFAIADPDDPDRMTYWRRGPRGLTAWPAQARYGPVLYKRDVPAGLKGQDRRDYVSAWFAGRRADWFRSVFDAINADRDTAAARFAVWSMRCCCCGRALTDPASKTLGIGPECRSGLPAGVLANLTEQVGRLHASVVANPQRGDQP